jgi:uncharacterized protein
VGAGAFACPGLRSSPRNMVRTLRRRWEGFPLLIYKLQITHLQIEPMLTVILLTISNIFMTFAWYGHLRHRNSPLWIVILASWGIAFFEYCFQVPANRIGSYTFTAAQLKIIQEVITLVVFSIFSITYLKEPMHWRYVGAFVLIVGAVALVFKR